MWRLTLKALGSIAVESVAAVAGFSAVSGALGIVHTLSPPGAPLPRALDPHALTAGRIEQLAARAHLQPTRTFILCQP